MSFRRIAGRGRPVRASNASAARLAAAISSREPPNHSGSVSTEMSAAPASAYSVATTAMSASFAMTPFEGDARLNSAHSVGWSRRAPHGRRSRRTTHVESADDDLASAPYGPAMGASPAASASSTRRATMRCSVEGTWLAFPWPRMCAASLGSGAVTGVSTAAVALCVDNTDRAMVGAAGRKPSAANAAQRRLATTAPRRRCCG
mmetsp:Transcript_10311/g.41719  ORF Transcript_10311/g.41719 Transcript_10311/m.41719 type:complete len:204 (+) Transcript_10311:1352-1963(+)